jgi:anaerobic selenocysteine-containing dehydrogenase
MTDAPTRTAIRTCPFCEAGCGLEITLRGEQIVRVRGDRDDVFSHGFICPKGSTLKQLHEDPDRLRRPLVKRDGEFVEVSWEEAFAEIERRLVPIIEAHGRDAVATYIGNPTAHNLSAMLYARTLAQGIGTRMRFSAGTVDQVPKQVAAGYMFGTAVTVPVPDIDRSDYMMILGANPYASNGSLCTAPDFPGRLEALRARGGRVVVVDPRRTKTAEEADEWVAIVPGTDAHFLMAIVHTLFDDGLADAGDHIRPWVNGWADIESLAAGFAPERVEDTCGVEATTIRRLARELAGAPTAAVYGRIGICTQDFGTLASWLVDVVNVVTGNLDRPGGAMFALPAAGGAATRGAPGKGKGFRMGRGHTRVRGLAEVLGEYPVVVLAEEIETEGPGQVRALVTAAGNPVLSTPNSERLAAALERLDFMVSIDIYRNETTRHADVILPPSSNLYRSHYDLLLLQFAVRNVANYSPPVLDGPADGLDEWEIMSRLALIAQGQGASADVDRADDFAITSLVQHAVGDASGPLSGRNADEILSALAARRGPERILDFMLRSGPYGDWFGARETFTDAEGVEQPAVTLALLEANPHGIDLGPLQPRIPEILRTPSGRIELTPPELVADCERLRASIGRGRNGHHLLVGRRDLRSNNSWMHNLNVLMKGKERCTLHIHPDDARALGLSSGDVARVTSRVGKIDVPVEITEAIRPGVVSMPHGWGHDLDGVALGVASARPGVNSNVLADEEQLDVVSGTAVVNGIPVTVVPA